MENQNDNVSYYEDGYSAMLEDTRSIPSAVDDEDIFVDLTPEDLDQMLGDEDEDYIACNTHGLTDDELKQYLFDWFTSSDEDEDEVDDFEDDEPIDLAYAVEHLAQSIDALVVSNTTQDANAQLVRDLLDANDEAKETVDAEFDKMIKWTSIGTLVIGTIMVVMMIWLFVSMGSAEPAPVIYLD